MTFSRFQKLNQYLHLSDADGKATKSDPLNKVRPALDITSKFANFFQAGQDISVDEAMIGYKGRIFFKQYMPQKPTKWGIKVWTIANSHSGYLLKCDIYLGKKQESQNDLLLGEQVVMHLTEPFTGKWHHVYFDNFFTLFRLMLLLLDKNTYACGTVRSNRQNWPEAFKKPKKLKLKQGESRVLQSGKVTATLWHDKRDVLMLSTNSNPLGKIEIERREKKSLKILYRVQSRLKNIIKAWVM
ncbi:GSCOCG00011411001-RA-CDS [Cotesia congregata]|nr:GSCOCG00011411001-RA-CDS [Cotesia congregata]